MEEIWHEVLKEQREDFQIANDGAFRLNRWLYRPYDWDLRHQILNEAYTTPYVVYPGATKMYHNLKENHVWACIKRDVMDFVGKYLIPPANK